MSQPDQTRGAADFRAGAGMGYSTLVLGLVGLSFGLALLKFGNPVIFEGRLPPPSNLSEIIHFSWPIQWGWAWAGLLGLLSLPLMRVPKGLPLGLLAVPAVWLGWQWVASFDSIQPALSRVTVIHFTFVIAFFYLGLLATLGVSRSLAIWVGIGIGLCLVISSGFQQQFGGLEETRVFYEKLARGEHPPEIQAEFERPEMRQIWQAPLFQMKVNSRRIYATLFYPNALAGAILLLTPGLLAAIWAGFREASPLARRILPGLVGLGAALCLLWSGSKAGWLIALLQVGLLLMRSSIPARWRRLVIVSVIVTGLAGLVIRNLDYFKRGATSVSARTDYWMSASQAFLENPLTGTGPGTFGQDYGARKAAESEMARLAHNDFVQQASDSGLIGFLSFGAFVIGGLWWIFRRLRLPDPSVVGLVWLGLLGWGLQSVSEFGLYIPAIAWPAFFLFGALSREAVNGIDTAPTNP